MCAYVQQSLLELISLPPLPFINPRRACAARVTVVVRVCLSVCLSVCLLSQNSPLERLFVLKILSRTQRAEEVKKYVGFSLKRLRCEDPAPSVVTAVCMVGHFSAERAHAHYNIN